MSCAGSGLQRVLNEVSASYDLGQGAMAVHNKTCIYKHLVCKQQRSSLY